MAIMKTVTHFLCKQTELHDSSMGTTLTGLVEVYVDS